MRLLRIWKTNKLDHFRDVTKMIEISEVLINAKKEIEQFFFNYGEFAEIKLIYGQD